MSKIKEYLKIALMNIYHNKGRSILTMLGIIIGISSVMLIVSLGDGIKSTITNELSGIAGGQSTVYSWDIDFTNEDIEAIRESIDHIKVVTFVDSYYGDVRVGHREKFANYIFGNPDYYYCTPTEPIRSGRYFNWDEFDDGAYVCVINEDGALELFGTTDCVGQYIEIEMLDCVEDFRVVGVRQKSTSKIDSLETTLMGRNIYLEIPKTTFGRITGYETLGNEGNQIMLMADDPEYAGDLPKKVISFLEARYDVRNQNMINMESFDSYLSIINNIINYITIFISFVAAIALFVGGIGVMNIMLVSVTERTREIGIRKSLGAHTSSIMIQFIAEAATITLIGGIIGMLIGFFGAEAICLLAGAVLKMKIVAHMSIPVMLGAMGFSTIIGIVFGVYPARKASKLSPIEALRHE